MDKIQADNRAFGLNKIAKHPSLSYRAVEMAPTKWERKRYGVAQCWDDNVVGIAAT